MRVDGKKIGKSILEDLRTRVQKLKDKKVTPHLAIILVGNNHASEAYVRQKKLRGEGIGAKVTVYHLSQNTSIDKLLKLLKKLNSDVLTHGIIVQRPLPKHIDAEPLNKLFNPIKDVDAFHPKSEFEFPIAKAVLCIIEHIYCSIFKVNNKSDRKFINWLIKKSIVVIGKGKTGGGPIIQKLRKEGVKLSVVDSKTINSEQLIRSADIIISAVGKPNVVRGDTLKRGVILISVGLHKGPDGKLRGDYEEKKIKNIASFYTPTPGGVGPVNVAMLLANLVTAAEHFPH